MTPARRILTLAAVAALGAGTWNVGSRFVDNVQFARAEAQVNQAMTQLQTPNDLSTVYKAINHAVENSVVQIQVEKSVHNVMGGGPGQKFFRFFGPNGAPNGQMPQMPQMPDNGDQNTPDAPDDGPEEKATGSGVIMNVEGGDGYIVTNNHVISDATKVTVLLNDGRHISEATVVAADPKSDLAVVKIKADKLIAAKWGNSDALEKGDIIVAFGSPFGYVGSMSHGIISATNRQAGVIDSKFSYENFIQVDAAINPGNSGGPLVDLRGEVVGINTAIASRSGMFSGIGFAIPSNQVKSVYESLRSSGKVTRGYLGVSIANVADAPDQIKNSIDAVGFTGDAGAFVNEVVADSPAVNILKPGDVITEIDGKPIKTVTELRNRVALTTPSTSVKLTVWRDKKYQQVDVKLGEQPDAAPMLAGADRNAQPQQNARLGVGLKDATADDLQAAGLPAGSKGAFIERVLPTSPAARLGIRPGELITRIGETEIASAEDARAALAKADFNQGVRIDILNREAQRMLTLKLPR